MTWQLSATRPRLSLLCSFHFLLDDWPFIAKPLVSILKGQFKVSWRLTYGISKIHVKDHESVQRNHSYVSPWYWILLEKYRSCPPHLQSISLWALHLHEAVSTPYWLVDIIYIYIMQNRVWLLFGRCMYSAQRSTLDVCPQDVAYLVRTVSLFYLELTSLALLVDQ